MPTSAADSFFVLLALCANLAVVAVAVTALVRRSALDALRPAALPLAAVVAVTATAGSLYLSEVAGYTPCVLCWYQRICMYPLAAILTIAAFRKDRKVIWYGAPLAVVGLGISIWHMLVERLPALQVGSCDPAAPCSIRWIDAFGQITIPYMAASGFVAILVALVLARRAGED